MPYSTELPGNDTSVDGKLDLSRGEVFTTVRREREHLPLPSRSGAAGIWSGRVNDSAGRESGAFLEMAVCVGDLIANDSVRSAWDDSSAVELMTIGALVGHLFLIVRRVAKRAEGLAVAPIVGLEKGGTPASAWVWLRVENQEDLDGPAHRQVRRDAQHVAEWGWEALSTEYRARTARLAAVLRDGPSPTGEVPGLSLSFHEYLATRVVELAVHADDLAYSVGLVTPLSAIAADVAIESMVRAARTLHGDLAVLRSLTRRERAPDNISVF